MKKTNNLSKLFGVDLVKFYRVWPNLVWYFNTWLKLKKQWISSKDKTFSKGKPLPCLNDRFEEGGTAKGQYFHQDLLVAQLIYQASPSKHVDVGSRVDGFVAHVAVFCPVEVIDVRPITTSSSNITFRQVDMMAEQNELVEYTQSLSCLHALEHFGLGRYGDPIDFNGHRKGFANLTKILAPNGKLYFSVPIGERQRIEFNAHRIFSIPYLLKLFGEQELVVDSFHYIDDAGELLINQDWLSNIAQRTFNLTHGCGIFTLLKKNPSDRVVTDTGY